jgi:hypothetical protein
MPCPPQPEDSRGSVTGFERGVVGLLDIVTDVTKASLHQLRYVGEWQLLTSSFRSELELGRSWRG